MSPGTRSVVSTHASVESAASGESKTLKSFDQDHEYLEQLSTNLDGVDSKDCDFFLLTTPQKFPTERLKDIPLHSDSPVSLDSAENNHGGSFICENTSQKSQSKKALLIPTDKSKSSFACVSVKNIFCVREVCTNQKPDAKYFLPRPPPPTITETLVERFKPFGWQNPSGGKVVSKVESSPLKSDESFVSLPKKKIKKRKAEKKEVDETLESSKRLLKMEHCEAVTSPQLHRSPSKKSKKHKIAEEGGTETPLMPTESTIQPSAVQNLVKVESSPKKKSKKKKHRENTNDHAHSNILYMETNTESEITTLDDLENSHKKKKKRKKEKKSKKKKSNKEETDEM